MQTFTRQQNRRRPSKNLNETQGSVLSNYNNTALAGYTTGNQNTDHLPDRLGSGHFGGKTSHNNSTDDGNAGGSFFPGPNAVSQQYSEQRSQQLSRGSKRAHHNKVGRRSQTTHEQSHAEQALGARPGIEASRVINATSSVLAPINNSLQSHQMRSQNLQYNQVNNMNMTSAGGIDKMVGVSNSVQTAPLTYDQKLLKA